MIQYIFLIVNYILILSIQASDINENGKLTTTKNWDVLIFTQHWPITVCYQWKEKTISNKCSLPTLNNVIWTIHGVWPTKMGTKGPQNCDNTRKFDPSQLKSIEQQLQLYWLNIESNTPAYSFWKHEWDKHGTCACQIEELDNESKYFNQGLNWIYKYEMSQILQRSNIVPDGEKQYYPNDVYNAVKDVTNKNPILECYKDSRSGKTYIFEIRICFNKSLDLIDCDGVYSVGHHHKHILTNCNVNESISYMNLVPNPPTTRTTIFRDNSVRKSHMEFLQSVIDVYRIISFIRWLTL